MSKKLFGYLNTIFNKEKKQVDLLLKNPTFIKSILELRKKWKIPETGLKGNEESKKWHYRLYAKADELDADTTDILKQYNSDLERIRLKLNLSEVWKDFIKYFLLFNKVGDLGTRVVIVRKKNYNTKENELFIQIFGDTRLEDIKEIWSEIKEHQKILKDYKGLSRIPNIKIFERDLYIFKLYKKGLTIDKILTEIRKQFVKDEMTLEDEDMYLMEEGAVKMVILRMNKQYIT